MNKTYTTNKKPDLSSPWQLVGRSSLTFYRPLKFFDILHLVTERTHKAKYNEYQRNE